MTESLQLSPHAWLSPDGLIIAFPRWAAIPGLIQGVTTRAALPQAGKDDFFATILHARQSGALPAMLTAGADQVHGDRIELIGPPLKPDDPPPNLRGDQTSQVVEFPRTDALITLDAGVLLIVQTADCLPVFAIDRERRIAGLAHCGWRGLRQGLAGKLIREMIAAMEGALSSESLEAWLGPCIRADNYKVGRELVEDFRAAFPGAAVSPDGEHLDLAAIARGQLEEAGLAADRIFDCELCTLAQPDLFHSYRAQGDQAGRMLSFIGFAE